jgi:hypothetical protein
MGFKEQTFYENLRTPILGLYGENISKTGRLAIATV